MPNRRSLQTRQTNSANLHKDMQEVLWTKVAALTVLLTYES